jgi:hypothetical protein
VSSSSNSDDMSKILALLVERSNKHDDTISSMTSLLTRFVSALENGNHSIANPAPSPGKWTASIDKGRLDRIVSDLSKGDPFSM